MDLAPIADASLTPTVPVALVLALAAFAAGVVDAIGGGGGLLTVPVLLSAGLPPQVALATNKGQAVFGAVSSAVSFWRRGGLDRGRAPVAFFFGAVGSAIGATLLLWMRPEPLKPVVLGLLVVAAVLVAWPRKPRARQSERAGSPAEGALPHPVGLRSPRLVLAVLALVLGSYDGFFGPGVGTMLIVAFAYLFDDTLTRASGNAKVVNLASNLAAFTLFALRGRVLWAFALPMALANASGAYVGARLAIGRGDRFVRAVVLCVVAALVVKLAVDLTR